MKDSDLIKLAKQNIAAGKRFAIKEIGRASCRERV